MQNQKQLPKGWKWVRLGDVAKVKNGKSNSQDATEDGKYPLFDRSNTIKRSYRYLFDTEAIIVPGEGQEFYPRYYKGKFDLHQRAYAIFDFDTEIVGKYLYYAILARRIYFQQVAVGSTVLSLRLGHFINMPIPLPPLPEQKAIAEVLSSLDDKIELLQEQNKTLEEMAQTLFRKWFIDNPERKRWKKVRLGEIFDFLEGPGIRHWQYAAEGIPFINIRLIQDGEINIEKASKISISEVQTKYRHFLLKQGDMIVSTSGTLGKTAIVRAYHLPLLLNTSVIRFRPKNNVSYSFMYQYLQSREFKYSLEDYAGGSVQKNFGPTHLKRLHCYLPSNSIMEKFTKFVDPLYDLLNHNYDAIRKIRELRDILLPKLISGEVRVKI